MVNSLENHEVCTPVAEPRTLQDLPGISERNLRKLNRWGNFGEVREGWVAYLLLINGEPLEDISVLRDPETALALIMKEGEIVKLRL